MKLLKPITGVFLALALISAVQADTTRITGSTAFRSSSHTAIQNIFDAGTLTFAYLDNSSGTGTISNSSAAIFKGNVDGVPTTIKTHWTGSEGGVQTVAGSPVYTVTYFADGTVCLPPPGNKLPNGTALTDASIPDVAMSDVFQASSKFKGTYRHVVYQTLNSTVTTPGLPSGQIVGVVQFKFVASNSAPASLSNITSQNARDLFSTGKMALSLFTGAVADEGFTIYATGRDFDSGTRLTALAEIGLGAQATVKQYQPKKGGVLATTCCGTLDGPPFTIWPAGSVNGIPYGVGNGGYNTGGDLTGGIANSTNGSTAFITYLGLSDAATAVGNGAHELHFNGITYSQDAVQEGQYTFWGYEHLYYRDTTPAGIKAIADKLALQIFNTDAPAPHYNDMKVSRTIDGGVVTQLF
jgi:hypothetical protein